jgi:hypothetical protein
MNKGCLIFSFVIIIIFAMVCFWFYRLFHIERKSKQEMIENYEKNKIEINEVVHYYKSILPKNSSCRIEFDGKEIEMFHLAKNGSTSFHWSSNKRVIPIDSLLRELNWTREQLRKLRLKMEEANVISIEGNNSIHLGWFRTGMAMYGITIHSSKLLASEIKMNNDSCHSLFYKDNISFSFGGGAFGPDCFLSIDD